METKYCPQCGTANAASFGFCQNCGTALPAVTTLPESPGTMAEPTRSTPVHGVQQAAPRQPAAPSQRPVVRQPPGYPQAVGQMGTGGFSVVDIWGPFAGYGQRVWDFQWLLDSLGNRAEDLVAAVTRRFQEREIPNARVEQRTLTGRGIAVERRPYYLIRRGITTEGLYIARFGQDLYISQVTYAKGAINPLRVLILVLMIAFQLFMTWGYTAAVNSGIESMLGSFSLLGGYGGGGGGGSGLGFLLCCVGPLGIVNSVLLALAGLHMIYKFLADKDPLALLRTPPNEFQQDDIVALEKAVEETVRQSLDAVGIDSALMPPAPEYGIRQRVI